MTMLVVGVGAAVVVVAVEAVQVARGHGLPWDGWMRETTARLHLQGTLAAMLLAALLLGVHAALSAWPVWAGAWLSRKLAALGMDALHPRPRAIEHRDGRRALVDGAGKGYQVINAAPKSPDALSAWLKERV